MELRRIIGVVVAVIAASLVMFAGRSCTKNIIEINKKSRGSATSSSPSYHLITETSDEYSASLSDASDHIEETTERQYETVTNMFGEVVDRIPVTSPEEANETTTTQSILGAYDERHTLSPEEARATTKYVEIPEKITIYVS